MEPRRTVAGYFTAAVLLAAVIVAVLLVLTSDEEDRSPVPVAIAFEPRYDGLDERREAAGVPTMAEGGGEHFHAELRLYEGGEEIPVPANIGIDPGSPPDEMAGLHTHDATGTIHNEAGEGATLADFFAVWGVPFSPHRLGPLEGPLRMWVDGKRSDAFGELPLRDAQEIIIAHGNPPRAAT